MKLISHENDLLPKLAWCAAIESRKKEVNLYHGERVEIMDNFFVEGAWDNDFLKGEFEKSAFFMGTGGKIMSNDKLIFSTPSHAHERLLSIKADDTLYISNSLPFVLYISGNQLLPEYRNYDRDLTTILEGVNRYKEYLPLKNNKEVRLHYFCNVHVSSDLEIINKKKIDIGEFEDFNDYYSKMKRALSELVNNAQSPSRSYQYGLVTTISKGYDAAACAAIAREVGCKTAVTFNAPEKYKSDCGDEIANKLGYENIVLKNANEYLKNESLVEAEFVSSGELGNGIVFTAFEEEFSGNMVLIGERGDQLWDKNKENANKELKFLGANVNSSMAENRLRIGYIFLPISLFGINEWPSIHRISNSEEMKQYSIGGNYDRPIPRRIVESKGVDRNMFGQEKKGAGFNYQFDNLRRIKNRMSDKSFDSFYDYYKENKRKVRYLDWIEFLWDNRNKYLGYFLRRLGLEVNLKPPANDKKVSNPGAASHLFNWGVHEMIKKYGMSKIK